MTKIDLITGILGSGKTTFIRKYAKYLLDKGLKIAILENDFGAVNIDMVMLSDLKSENCHIEMIVGGADADCHKRRFKTKLITLGMQHFDRVIIEPSGIFDMDEFFDTLYESPLDRWFETGSIISIIDAGLNDNLSEQMNFLLGSEAACCGKLILSKLENNNADEIVPKIINQINYSLKFINCQRRFCENDIIVKNWNDLNEKDFNIISNAGYRNESYVKLFTRDTISSKTHYFMHIHIEEKSIKKVINDIFQDSSCGKIFRIKGSLQAEDGSWLRINAMQECIEISPASEGQAVLIVIGDDMNLTCIDNYLKTVNTDKDYVCI